MPLGNGAGAAAGAESALRPVNYRLLFEHAPGLYLILDPELTIVGASDAYLRATMTERAAIVGHNLYEIFPDNPDSDEHAAGSDQLRLSLQRVLSEHLPDTRPVQRYDIRRPAAEGGGFVRRYWSPCNLPILTPDGRLLWILHCVEDVTHFVEWMEAGGAPLARGELGQSDFSLVHLARGLEAHVAERTAEVADGKRRLEQELAERRQLERQFQQAQKMEAVGRLAGGVAHDFNNLLTVIQGFTEMLVEGETSHGQREKLTQIQRAAERAAGLTRQLLAFSRQQIMHLRPLDLNQVVRDVAAMLTRVIGEDIEFVTRLDPGLGTVLADAGQMEQVLMNLAVNARDAMPHGGRITVETSNVELDAAFSGHHGAEIQPGPYLMLAVTDTGTGMDAATQARIFEPFFTTKDVHKGTGLGLSTVYGVVKQTGGTVWVYSEPGQGTCFKIYLPRVLAAAETAPAAGGAQRPLAGSETILVVEDEEGVRELIRTVLTSHGYEVMAVEDGAQAEAVLGQTGPRIQMLLTDLVLPGGSGRELAELYRRLEPTGKVLYMSGYTDDVAIRNGVLGQGMPFLQKPFRPLDLLKQLRALLDAG